jgi:ribosomal protein L7/L12
MAEAAVAALWQGEKIEVIKIVRETRRIDLKAAKDAVEVIVEIYTFARFFFFFFLAILL